MVWSIWQPPGGAAEHFSKQKKDVNEIRDQAMGTN